jgi:hypothetical protein
LFFRTVPPANTLVRQVNENAFASILRPRLFRSLADRFMQALAFDYDPVLLRMPFGFHLTVNTLPCGSLLPPASETLLPLLVMTPLI